jgi:GNAT superfamily N-acetyltransferase
VTNDLFQTLERYYDEAPRASATTEEIGPFTLFVRSDPQSWPYYARPRLGWQGTATLDDVRRVVARQRELDQPQAFEWVDDVTPGLVAPVRAAGLAVHEYPLLVLAEPLPATPVPGVQVEIRAPDAPDLGAVNASVHAAFADTDAVGDDASVEVLRDRMRRGLVRLAGAVDATGPVGGGSHGPRGTVTELTGIAVLPRARRQGLGALLTAVLAEDALSHGASTVFLSAGSDRTADVYARVGFARIGTACVAEEPS